jgi:serine protease
MTYSPMIALNVDVDLLRALAEDPEVVNIQVSVPDALHLTQSLPLIGMPAAYAAGATGQGRTVAILDSGARVSHEFLNSRITLGACYNTNVAGVSSSRCPGGVTSATTIASGDDCTASNVFGCGHGTHVAGTAAGFISNPAAGNPAHGVARNANIMSINVFSLFPASQCGSLPAGFNSCILSWPDDQIAGLERVYTLRNTVAFGAVNMSLGGGRHSTGCTSDPRRDVIQRLTNAGIPVSFPPGTAPWTQKSARLAASPRR